VARQHLWAYHPTMPDTITLEELGLLTAKDVTELLHVSKTSLLRLVEQRKIRAIKWSKRTLLFEPADVDKYLAKCVLEPVES
jgi:excisionase family DNA binding protein